MSFDLVNSWFARSSDSCEEASAATSSGLTYKEPVLQTSAYFESMISPPFKDWRVLPPLREQHSISDHSRRRRASAKRQRYHYFKRPGQAPKYCRDYSITTLKKVKRLFAFNCMYHNYLPENRPNFIPEREWNRLVALKNINALVVLTKLTETSVTVSMPESLDLIYHSLANNHLDKCNLDRDSRFRWWSDCPIELIKPVKNKISESRIKRTIRLPRSICEHPFIKVRYKNRDDLILLKIGSLFNTVIGEYVHSNDLSKLSDILGKSRMKLHQTRPLQEILNEEVTALVAKMNVEHYVNSTL